MLSKHTFLLFTCVFLLGITASCSKNNEFTMPSRPSPKLTKTNIVSITDVNKYIASKSTPSTRCSEITIEPVIYENDTLLRI